MSAPSSDAPGGRPGFVITIDTEGDNLWSRPKEIATRNSAFLPRFQQLCERTGFRPTYLVDYEMCRCPVFQAFGRDVLGRKTAEIGMHLHAWNTPPHHPLDADTGPGAPYLIEYPESVMREKVRSMTRLLEDTFQVKPVSHRAGRWALDDRYARILVEEGYQVDCSVSPFVSWARYPGGTGQGGTDYSGNGPQPFWMTGPRWGNLPEGALLQVPVTTWPRPGGKNQLKRLLRRLLPATRRSLDVLWMRPNGSNRADLLRLADVVAERRWAVLEFMIHSSEFMPGGSPYFRHDHSVENLFADLEAVWAALAGRFRALTLQELRSEYQAP